eukprot:1952257-Prymnesium_polylepis.1
MESDSDSLRGRQGPVSGPHPLELDPQEVPGWAGSLERFQTKNALDQKGPVVPYAARHRLEPTRTLASG